MLFDKLCGIAERRLPEVVEYLHNAKFFHFEGSPVKIAWKCVFHFQAFFCLVRAISCSFGNILPDILATYCLFDESIPCILLSFAISLDGIFLAENMFIQFTI